MKRVVPEAFPSDPLVTDANLLGRTVRAARSQSGLTLEDAALAVGVAKQTLNNLEMGREGVSLGVTFKIMRGLGIALFAVPVAAKDRAMRKLKEIDPDAT